MGIKILSIMLTAAVLIGCGSDGGAGGASTGSESAAMMASPIDAQVRNVPAKMNYGIARMVPAGTTFHVGGSASTNVTKLQLVVVLSREAISCATDFFNRNPSDPNPRVAQFGIFFDANLTFDEANYYRHDSFGYVSGETDAVTTTARIDSQNANSVSGTVDANDVLAYNGALHTTTLKGTFSVQFCP